MKFQFEAYKEADGRLRAELSELDRNKVELNHKINLMSQHTQQFLASFIDQSCSILNLDIPSDWSSNESMGEDFAILKEKMKFVGVDVKSALEHFASESKVMHQKLTAVEKRLKMLRSEFIDFVSNNKNYNGSANSDDVTLDSDQILTDILNAWRQLRSEKERMEQEKKSIELSLESLKEKSEQNASSETEKEQSWQNQKKELEEKLSESESRNQKLKQLALKSKKEIQTLKVKVDEVSETCSSVQKELEAKVQECIKLQTDLDTITAQHQETLSKLQLATEEKGAMDEMVQSVNKQLLLETEKFGDLLRAKTDELEQNKDAMNSKIAELVSQLRALEQQLAEEKAAKVKEVEDMRQRMQEESSKQEAKDAQSVAMLDLEMADMRRSLQVMQDKLTSAESERDSISAQLEDMTAQKESVGKEKKEVEDKSGKMRQLLLKQKKELEELRHSESDLKSQVAELERQLTESHADVENLKVQLAEEAQRVVTQITQIAGLEKRTAAQSELLQSMKEEVAGLESKLEASNTEFEQYKARVHTVLKQQKEKTQHLESIRSLTQERDGAVSRLEQSEMAKEEMRREVETVQLERDRLQKELHSLTLLHSQLTQQVTSTHNTHKNRLEELRLECERGKSALEVSESGYKTQIANLTQYYQEKLSNEAKEFNERIDLLKEQLNSMGGAVNAGGNAGVEGSNGVLIDEERILAQDATSSGLMSKSEMSGQHYSLKRVRRTASGKRTGPIGMERSEGDGSESIIADSPGLLRLSSIDSPGGRVKSTSISESGTVMPLDQLLVTVPAPAVQQAPVPNLYPLFNNNSPNSASAYPFQQIPLTSPNHIRSPSESSTVSGVGVGPTTQHISSAAAFSQSLELQKQLKKVAHLTELLNESEGSIQRLTDQSQVLKDEIRRLEASWDQTSSNMDYLKNILVKFFRLPAGGEKEQLVPVLTMLLKLSQEEKTLVQQLSQGGVGSGDGGPGAVPSASNWSSYMPRWSGLM
ncbi:uncharacterized protein LOC142341521 [Convolutriloba macropyga]|uniref:uncharacterized protein LOC142341521 n=1 Tax=Convolutriloba macropyga TaxID=536237 RepID=UPI003F51C5D4